MSTLTTYAVRFALGAVIGVAVNRALGPEGRGAFAVLVGVATVALNLGHLSIEEYHVSFWGRLRGGAAITANSLLFGVLLGVACAVVAGVVVVGLGPGTVPVPGRLMLITALAWIPCAMTEKLLARITVLRSRLDVNNRAGLLSSGVHCAALVLLFALGRLSLGWVVALWTACAALPLALLIPATRPRLRYRDLALARQAIRTGLRYHIGLVSLFLLLRSDILILGAMTTTDAVGLYAAAVTVAEVSRAPSDIVANIAMPRQLERDERSAAVVTAAATRVAALVAVASAVAMYAAAPFVIPLVYGRAFTGSVGPLLALAPGLLTIGASRPIGAFLLRLDRPLLNSATSAAALLANVGLNLVLIPRLGIVGSALASSIAYAVLAALQIAWFLRATGTRLRQLVPGPSDVRYVWGLAYRTALSPAA